MARKGFVSTVCILSALTFIHGVPLQVQKRQLIHPNTASVHSFSFPNEVDTALVPDSPMRHVLSTSEALYSRNDPRNVKSSSRTHPVRQINSPRLSSNEDVIKNYRPGHEGTKEAYEEGIIGKPQLQIASRVVPDRGQTPVLQRPESQGKVKQCRDRISLNTSKRAKG